METITMKKIFSLILTGLLLLTITSQYAWARRRRKPSPAAARITGEENKTGPFSITEKISVVPIKQRGAHMVLITDSFNRILKSFAYKTAAQETAGEKKKKGSAGAPQPVTFTVGLTAGPVHHILLVNKGGKTLARSSFRVKGRTGPWDEFRIWIYKGHKGGGAENRHYRGCFFRNSSYFHGSANLAFKPNFADNIWGGFMGQHRRGNFKASRGKLKRSPCMNSEPFIASCVNYAKKHAGVCAGRGIEALSLREMPSVTLYADPFDFDFSPTALTAFRAWCREKYKGLDALNKQWGTEFKAWEEIVPETTNQTRMRNNPHYKKTTARKIAGIMIAERRLMHDEFPDWNKQNYSAWSDHREFMDDTMAAVLKKCTQAADAEAPNVRTGILGTQYPSAFGGYDYSKLMDSLEWIEPCGMGMSWELLTSMAGPEHRFAKMVSVGRPSIQRYVITSLFLKGGHGVILRDAHSMWHRRKLRHTGMTFLRNTFKELTGGLGKLRMICESVKHPVGIYHNQASQRMAWLTDALMDGTAWPRRLTFHHQPRDSMVRAYTGINLAVEDSGYQARAVCGEQVRGKGLDTGGLKVIFMSRITALSGEEARAITAWVASGGVLVTDGALGSMDLQCRRRNKGLLDSIAGLNRTNFRLCDMDGGYFPFFSGMTEQAEGADRKRSAGLLDGVKAEALLVHCPDLRAAGAEVIARAGKAPVLSVKKYGKGRVICANVYWADYIKTRETGGGRASLGKLAGNILKTAGVQPHYRIGAEKAEAPVPHIEQYLFRDGSLSYAAFNVQARPIEYPRQSSGYHNNYEAITGISPAKWTGPITGDGRFNIYNVRAGDLIPLTVGFADRAHTFNSRTGSYLGNTKTVTAQLDPMGFVWLARLPYRVNDIAVRLKPAEDDPCLAEYEAKISCSGGKPGRHVFTTTVTDPDGRICDCLRKNIIAESGTVRGSLHIPENGKKGTWTIRFRDAATGITGSGTFSKEADPVLAGKIPLSFPVQKGRLFANIGSPADVTEQNGRVTVRIPASVWREGVKESGGKIMVRVNSPWNLEQDEFDLARVTAEQSGDIMITAGIKADSADKTDLTVSLETSADDGKTLKKQKKIPGNSIAAQLKKGAPISIGFDYYHGDIQRVRIKGDRCVCIMPLTVRCSAGTIPKGTIRMSADNEWSVEPSELDLETAVLSANGQNTVRVSGPLGFTESPVVSLEVETEEGFSLSRKRYIPVCRSEYTAKPPVLDGVFDEQCWKTAQRETHSFRSVGKVPPEKFPLHFRVCHDSEHIYVAVEVKGLNPRILKVNPPIRDGFKDAVWCDENVQIFLDPTQRAGEVTYRMVMNYAGRTYSTAGEDLTKYGWPGWKVDWEMKGRKISDGYAVECAAPYTIFDTSAPASGDVWAFNVVRMTTEPYHGWPDYYGSWSDVGSSTNASYWGDVPGPRISSHLFGRLLFVSGKK